MITLTLAITGPTVRASDIEGATRFTETTVGFGVTVIDNVTVGATIETLTAIAAGSGATPVPVVVLVSVIAASVNLSVTAILEDCIDLDDCIDRNTWIDHVVPSGFIDPIEEIVPSGYIAEEPAIIPSGYIKQANSGRMWDL